MSEKLTLANVIKDARKKLNISTRDLAERKNLNKSEISKIENGLRKKPNIMTLGKLGDELNLDIKLLMELAGYDENYVFHARNIYFHMMADSRTGTPLEERAKLSLLLEQAILNENLDKYQKQIDAWGEICKEIDRGTFIPTEENKSTNKQDYLDAQVDSKSLMMKYQTELYRVDAALKK